MISTLPTAFLALLSFQDGSAPGGAANGASGGGSSLWIPMAIIFAIFWVVMIGPERKKAKQRELMLAGIKKGDRVLMTSGMYGEVREVRDGICHVQIADGVRVKFSAAAVQDLVDAAGISLTTPDPKAKAIAADGDSKSEGDKD